MIQRDRSGPDSGSHALPPPRVDLDAPLAPPLLTACPARSLWEQWYERASPAQRLAALAQAAGGLVQAHQLPPPETPRGGRSLADLLSCPVASLTRSVAADWRPHDADLDETQKDAVGRALHTPDVALIQGFPGSGKSRVVTELLRQAVGRGQRVLFVAATTQALARALAPLADELGVVVCLPAEEPALPPALAGFTLGRRLRAFHDEALPAAREAARAAQATLDDRREAAAAWDELDALLASAVLAERSRLLAQQDELPAAVEAWLAATDDDPGRAGWREAQQRCQDACRLIDARLTALQAQADQLTAELNQHQAMKHELAPLVEARRSTRPWSWTWWKATVGGDARSRLESVDQRCREAADKLDALQLESADLAGRRDQERDALEQARSRLTEQEAARRRAELRQQLTQAEGELEQHTAAWRGACDRLRLGDVPHGDARAVEAARAAWRQRLANDEEEAAFRRRWLEALEQAGPGLAEQLIAQGRVVAAPLAALPAAADVAGPDFDLLVVEEAHRLGESELINASRRARRWVLVGEPPAELPIAAPPRRPAAPRRTPPVPLLHRLWARLHPDPRRLPARWRRAGGRLIAFLRPVTAEHQAHAHREAVFDRPEIEVVIVAPPGQEPRVAEVHFPGSTRPAEAREYIAREVQELAVQASGPAPRWSAAADAVRLELSPGGGDSVCVPLEPGVCEVIGRRPRAAEGELDWHTEAVAFDRAAGWDLERAERWAEERLGLRDGGRTAVLDRVHRSRPALAGFLGELLYASSAATRPEPAGAASWLGRPAVELVPVPGRGEGRRGEPDYRRADAGLSVARPRARAGGAGLEADLADAPRPDLVPPELRAQLPPRGVVNHAEARAVVEALERLVSDAEFRAAAAVWRGGPAVAVLSLFAAQVELLRLLVGRSAVVAQSGVGVEVGTPAALAHRECLVALVSLTRSHTHLAVPFSDHPHSLVLALTRPVARLVLFADPGTLARRSQWFGGLEHLDETAGPLEQALVGQLLARLGEPEPATRPGRTLESSRV